MEDARHWTGAFGLLDEPATVLSSQEPKGDDTKQDSGTKTKTFTEISFKTLPTCRILVHTEKTRNAAQW